MADAAWYGPWEIAGYALRIDCEERVRLVVARRGRPLRSIPPAVRESADFAWVRHCLEAVAEHRRTLRALLERAMVEAIPLSAADLALLVADPVGRALLRRLVLRIGGTEGRVLPEEGLLETAEGDLLAFHPDAAEEAGGRPSVWVAHPLAMEAAGTRREWSRWLNRQPFRQPFPQVRRPFFRVGGPEEVGKAQDAAAEPPGIAPGGEWIRWSVARAVLEGRGWTRVTKTGAERPWPRAGLAAHLEFREPWGRGVAREVVRVGRIYFLPPGERPASRARPGLPLAEVPPLPFSETLYDVSLALRAALPR